MLLMSGATSATAAPALLIHMVEHVPHCFLRSSLKIVDFVADHVGLLEHILLRMNVVKLLIDLLRHLGVFDCPFHHEIGTFAPVPIVLRLLLLFSHYIEEGMLFFLAPRLPICLPSLAGL